MSLTNVFKTTTGASAALDGSAGVTANRTVSDFLTVQSFTNFAAMTGAITAAWKGLQAFLPEASAHWVPFAFALVWAIISVLISWEGFKKANSDEVELGTLMQAVFLAIVNALVLGSAVVGAGVVVGSSQNIIQHPEAHQ